jgi:hypothetical protein
MLATVMLGTRLACCAFRRLVCVWSSSDICRRITDLVALQVPARSESKSDSISVQHFYGGEGRGGDSGRVLNAASDVGAC